MAMVVPTTFTQTLIGGDTTSLDPQLPSTRVNPIAPVQTPTKTSIIASRGWTRSQLKCCSRYISFHISGLSATSGRRRRGGGGKVGGGGRRGPVSNMVLAAGRSVVETPGSGGRGRGRAGESRLVRGGTPPRLPAAQA